MYIYIHSQVLCHCFNILTVAVFSFQQAMYSTNESASFVQVSLEYGVLDRTVELQLLSRSGSAIGTLDNYSYDILMIGRVYAYTVLNM